ncbi:MAG: hypothetical protein ACJ8AD_02385 [Gemmatimonadaceae bacterium]
MGCDKRAEGEPPPKQFQTSLAGKPTVLFLMFGERSDPRLLPVATIGHGRISPITLDANGWRSFDQLYFKAGSEVAIYQDGRSLGNAVIRRGMWEGNDPLYKLPGCKALRPLAAATLADGPTSASIELLGTSDPLPATSSQSPIEKADEDSARAVATRAGPLGGLTAGDQTDLDLSVRAIRTGATAKPTLVAAFMERGGGGAGRQRHLFVIADADASRGGYAPTFTHTGRDSVPEFLRLIDHADITGEGVDEIILEGWRVGGDSYLIIMGFQNGRWHELARGANNWCADPPKQ